MNSRHSLSAPGLIRTDFGVRNQRFLGDSDTTRTGQSWSDQGGRVRRGRIDIHDAVCEGYWEFLSVGGDLLLLAGDTISSRPRTEQVPGEGCYEFYYKMSGSLLLEGPAQGVRGVIGPGLHLLQQSENITLRASVEANVRQTSFAVFCRPALLHQLLRCAPGDRRAESLRQITAPIAAFDCKPIPVTAKLRCCAQSVINCSYEGSMRSLYLEGKILEFVCLAADALMNPQQRNSAVHLDRRLVRARNCLDGELDSIPRLAAVARQVGLSKSKLKQDFKSNFGKSFFDYALDRRMAVALDLLRVGEMPIGEIAAQVGYRHHTSFTCAFKRHYGFSPKDAIKGQA